MISDANFNAESAASEVAQAFREHIEGKIVLITGCSPNGIGEATAAALAMAGVGTLFISGRAQAKLDATASKMRNAYPSVTLRTLLMDLSSQSSVRTAAAEVNSLPGKIDVLINNAAAMALPQRTTNNDGIEMQFATNHIGHFLFTNLILGKLKASATESTKPGSTRIINLTSKGHQYSPLRFSDVNWTGVAVPPEESPNWELVSWRGEERTAGYSPMGSYGASKTANILFTAYLSKHLTKNGIRSFAVNPGAVLSEGGSPFLVDLPEALKGKLFLKSLDQGASTTIVAAFDPELSTEDGIYLDDCHIATPSSYAIDEGYAQKLWELSNKMVGADFQI